MLGHQNIGNRSDEYRGKVDTIVLMGSRLDESDPICEAEGVKHKALAKIGKRTIIECVLQALLSSSRINDIYVCLQSGFKMPKIETHDKRVKYIEICGDTPADTIAQFVRRHDEKLPLLATTSDHALLCTAIIDDFIDSSFKTSSDMSVGFANITDIWSVFPNTSRTCLKFRDGWFSVCNLYMIKAKPCLKFLQFWADIGRKRKKPFALAYDIGFLTLVNYVMRFSSLDESLSRLGKKSDCILQSVTLPYAEAAVDVDKISDLTLVRNYISQMQQ